MWDMPDNATSIALIEAFVKADKPVGAVCHAPVALVNVHGVVLQICGLVSEIAKFAPTSVSPTTAL